jgi:undecaprenyl diphosphate synthase
MKQTQAIAGRHGQANSTLKPLTLQHVAIIMDGNRRWAGNHHLPKLMGHRQGVKVLKGLVKHAAARGLKFLTVYAFSSENWARDQAEVDYLLELLAQVLSAELPELHANNVRLRFLGRLEEMPSNLKQAFESASYRTRNNTGLSLQVAVNYGSRLEIVDAVKKLAFNVQAGELEISRIDAELLSSYLYTHEIPDPDLVIRTGGEMRLSNYLLWQAAYSELYVSDVLWPDFTPDHFEAALVEFNSRQRRYGL